MTNSFIDKVHPDIKYYLLGWKDRNFEVYKEKYGTQALKDLTRSDILDLFSLATDYDNLLLKIAT